MASPGACNASGRWQLGPALPSAGRRTTRPPLRLAPLPSWPQAAMSRLDSGAAQACRRTRASSAPVAAAAAPQEQSLADDPVNAFDWKLSLALAGCAFEAYNEVVSEDGSSSLKMTSMGGTEITFVNKDFLRRKFAGLMEVTVKSASDLNRADWWPGAKSDPYAVLTIGDSAAATAVVQQELNPRWDEKHYLFVSDPTSQRLTVRVLDADLGKSDDLLGNTMRGLQDVVDGESHDLELPLRGAKGSGGTISLSLRFLPFDDDVLASEAASSQMGGPVLGSPPIAITGSEWRTLQKEVLNAAADAMFDPVAYIDNPDSDTQAWLFWNPTTREVCIAFRGTEQVKWKDILTDLRLVPSSLDPEGVAETPFWQRSIRQPRSSSSSSSGGGSSSGSSSGEGGGGEETAGLGAAVARLQSKRLELRAKVAEKLQERLQGVLGGAKEMEQQAAAAAAATAAAVGQGEADEEAIWVHSGFLEAYSSVRPVVLRLLDTVLAGEEEPWTLYLTGHSLGAALCSLCAYDCARRSWRTTAHPPRLVHYNYGSPRVGNRAFADEFDRLVPNAWRVANTNDAVTLVPRMLGYCHIGHKAELGPEGQLDLQWDSRQGLGEGAEMANVALAAAVNLPALAEQLMAEQEGAESSGSPASSNPALLSAAAAVAAAAGAWQEQAGGEEGSVPNADEVQLLIQREMEAMQRLLDGSALSEHLEPLYLENLRAAIAKLGAERQQQ